MCSSDLKEATGLLDRAAEIRERCGEDFVILSGDDATSCDLMLQGGQGTISVSANVVPGAVAAMVEAATAGDEARARALDAPLQGLHHKLFLESNPIPVKWALAEMGRIESGIRLPMTPFAEQYHDELRAALREAGALN